MYMEKKNPTKTVQCKEGEKGRKEGGEREEKRNRYFIDVRTWKKKMERETSSE